MRVTSSLTGDWDKAIRVLRELQRQGNEYKEEVRKIGEEVARKVKSLIESQALDLEQLDSDYLRKKTSEGDDTRILIRTSQFINSIQVTDIQASANGINVKISVMDGTTETGISMIELASFLEYGTSKMPARKPFEKSWEEMKEEVTNEARERLSAIIKEVIG